ncbi:hypothetical protein TNCV_4087951 [Trichonephila clavipes]|nr:hypothetical protein TNCV_4087951 [Trichonephila clavipes]
MATVVGSISAGVTGFSGCPWHIDYVASEGSFEYQFGSVHKRIVVDLLMPPDRAEPDRGPRNSSCAEG